MKINCGIIGLPNVGKSTLFKFLTHISVQIENFPFCTIQPNIATVKIPDARLYQLNNIIKTRSIVHGTTEFIDIAGLIKGASQGTGLGNKILHYIQTTQILCHVVRCFDNDTIFHTEDSINPRRDIKIINTELILFDILQCEEHISFLQKKNIIINHNIDQKLFILQQCLKYLYNGKMLRTIQFSKIENQYIQQFNFLTFKPVIYIANVNEHYINNNYFQELKLLGIHDSIPVIPFRAMVNNFSDQIEEQKHILNSIVNNILTLLKLNTFFTVNTKMIRSWIYVIGTTALVASNYIHSDFKKGFIRVQVIEFEDFIKYQGESGAKKFGKILYAGKDHQIKDGNILKFLFHT